MVELAELQAIYYIIATAGILVASINYLRVSIEDSKKKRVETTNNVMSSIASKDGIRSYFELLNMEWTDYDDFERKYGTDFNFESAVTRFHTWTTYDILGNLLRKGLADEETIYDSYGTIALWTWHKFESILDEHRRRYVGKDSYRGWEYLANAMMRIKKSRDPEFTIPEAYSKYIPDK
jgi:hypothetical protein